MEVTIYHNARCSKSRQALALLGEHGIQPTVIHYLDTPPTAAELKSLLKKLALPVRDLIRRKETEYSMLGLDDETLSDKQLIDAMVQHPRLIERPIVVFDEKAIVARPPERIKEML